MTFDDCVAPEPPFDEEQSLPWLNQADLAYIEECNNKLEALTR